MAEQNKGQVKSGNEQIARHLVSLPSIILTRIDANAFKPIKNKKVATKNTLNNAVSVKKKPTSPVKPLVKSLSPSKTESRPRGRPRKEEISKPKSQKPMKKSVNVTPTLKANKTINKSKLVSKPQISTAKNILKKTMLQKKSKVLIPQAKKTKMVKKNTVKKPPQKLIKPIKTVTLNEIPIKKPAEKDSSEDEFLYDELINEFENTISKQSKTIIEKTTNITLKPSLGNKPPTIVKGGIIKINNLPADLKTIASSGQQLPNNKINESHAPKRPNVPKADCPVPSKKPSPWPISIASPSKSHNKSSPTKNSPISIKNSQNTSSKQKTDVKPKQKQRKVTNNAVTNMNGINNSLVVETKSISSGPAKRKIGPKLASKIDPAYHSVDDDNLSDEYTEVETLENLDYDVDGTFSNQESIANTVQLNTKTSNKPTIASLDITNDDEDPNLDLLRILTDESEDCPQTQSEIPSGTTVQEINPPCGNEKIETRIGNETTDLQKVNGSSSSKELSVNHQTVEEPKVRTIYDLINEVSLLRPSWNLHIIPETNAFCIAQVTKGRLGLPTLKKCIELDPEDYNAKVYIHQYHIKRFDGIYDSEDTILALIEEIDSIKA